MVGIIETIVTIVAIVFLFLNVLGKLGALLSRFFSLATERTLEPSVPTLWLFETSVSTWRG